MQVLDLLMEKCRYGCFMLRKIISVSCTPGLMLVHSMVCCRADYLELRYSFGLFLGRAAVMLRGSGETEDTRVDLNIDLLATRLPGDGREIDATGSHNFTSTNSPDNIR